MFLLVFRVSIISMIDKFDSTNLYCADVFNNILSMNIAIEISNTLSHAISLYGKAVTLLKYSTALISQCGIFGQ